MGKLASSTYPPETYNIIQEKRKQRYGWINKLVSTNVKGKDQNKSWMTWLESKFGKEMNKLQRQKKPTTVKLEGMHRNCRCCWRFDWVTTGFREMSSRRAAGQGSVPHGVYRTHRVHRSRQDKMPGKQKKGRRLRPWKETGKPKHRV